MLVLNYYRLYISLYIYSLILLLVVGFVWDVAVTTDGLKFPKTITALLVFIFSYLTLVLRHMLIEKAMNLEALKLHPKFWFTKFLKSRKKNINRVKSKMKQKVRLYLIYVLLFFLFLFPLLIGETIKHFSPSSVVWFYSTAIALTGAFLKGLMWFPTLFFSKFLLFWNKKRKLVLV